MASDTVFLRLLPSGKQGKVGRGSTVADAAHQLGVDVESICGGRLTCGKCLIDHAPGLSEPQAPEQAFAKRHAIDLRRQRLACVAQVADDTSVRIPETHKAVIHKASGQLRVEIAPAVRVYYVEVQPATLGGKADLQRLQIALAEQWKLHDVKIDPFALRKLQACLRDGKNTVSVTIWQGQEIVRVQPAYDEALHGLAIDVGTTTIAAHLCDLHTGQVLTTETMMNPQVRYGEDIVSRISYCIEHAHGLTRLHRVIIKAINDLAAQAAERMRIPTDAITDCVVVGNTVMLDLLLGIHPVELGSIPFTLATQDAVDIKARDLGLKALSEGGMVHILPSIAGYVGADNVGVLLSELPDTGNDNTIIIDVGTNAEILLVTSNKIYSTSSPTGPAFEGAQIEHGQRAAIGAIERIRITEHGVRYKIIGDTRWSDEFAPDTPPQPTGICGSGIIEGVAELFLHGIIDRSGLFQRTASHPNVEDKRFAVTDTIAISQHDVRAIQLAKAALYAGIESLTTDANIATIDRIKLAGAFGSYIDPTYALILGLIPDCPLERVESIGNAAGDGALMALLSTQQRALIQQAVQSVEYIETASKPDFQDMFVAALPLPHSVDTFSHIQHLLPVEMPKRRLKRRPRPTTTKTVFIACGALAREVIAIRDKYQWNVKILALPALLHNRPTRIPDAVERKITSLQQAYDRILVIYGDCGTAGQLDNQLQALGIRRVAGPHCYEMYAGEAFQQMMTDEPGTFFLTDYLAQSFDHLVIEGLGLDQYPENLDVFFGNYKRVVYLPQREDPKLVEKATAAARRLNLPLEIKPTGYGMLETRLVEFMNETAE